MRMSDYPCGLAFSFFMNTIKGLFFKEPAMGNAIGHIVAEIWKDGIYHPFLHGKKDLVIIDAGANTGFFSYYASEYAKTIYAIEPSQEHFEVLEYMVKHNELEDIVKPRKFALSMKDDKGDLTHYSNRTMYSLYENLAEGNNTGLVATGKEETVLKRIDTFIKEENIDHVDFLKLDVEGVEYEILGSESFSNIASKIDAMVVEIHSYSGRNPNQLMDSLRINGFDVGVIPNEAQLIYATKKK